MGLAWVAWLGSHAPRPAWLVIVFLLSLRVGAILLLTPILSTAGVPASMRVLLVIGLAAALALGISEAPAAAALYDTGALLAAAMRELALGTTLAFGMLVAFGAISFAGRLIDVQIGFGMAQVLDPATHRQVPVIQSAFDRVGVLAFFLLNGHHALLRAVAYSITQFPPGRPWPLAAAAPMVIKQAAALFALGFALAVPVVACLMLVELGLGVVARNLPQFNMFVIGVPVKIVVGMLMLSLWFAGIGDAMSRIYAFVVRSWESGFAAMAGGR